MESAGAESENVAAVGINRAASSKSRVNQFGVSGDKMSKTARRVVHPRHSTLRLRIVCPRPDCLSKVFDKDFKPTFT
jgi:hypothetical protein